jgi:peptidyl-prolyl cis-trans isomerase SurA
MLKSARKPRLMVLLAALALAVVPAHAQEEFEVLDEIVAKVNTEIITLSDLEKELVALRAALSEQITNPQMLEREYENRRRARLKEMIENRMMIQKAEEIGITAGIDTEVNAYLEEWRRQTGIPTLEMLDQELRKIGSSLMERRDMIKQRMIVDNLVHHFVSSKITLLTSEIEAYYQKNRDRFAEPAEVELAEVLFLTEGKSRAEVRAKAEEALGKLQSGVDFQQVAREYSDGPTAARGGGIGTFRQGSMAAKLEEHVFNTEEGRFTGVLEFDFGFQIVKVLDKKPAAYKPLEEVRPLIQSELYQQKGEPELQRFVEDLRQQSFIYIAPQYRNDFDVEGL